MSMTRIKFLLFLPLELKKHEDYMHENPRPRKKFYCKVCEKEIFTGRMDHLQKYHSGKDGNFDCPKCGKKFHKFTQG